MLLEMEFWIVVLIVICFFLGYMLGFLYLTLKRKIKHLEGSVDNLALFIPKRLIVEEIVVEESEMSRHYSHRIYKSIHKTVIDEQTGFKFYGGEKEYNISELQEVEKNNLMVGHSYIKTTEWIYFRGRYEIIEQYYYNGVYVEETLH